MVEPVAVESQPMLYITTRTSDRASSVASVIKVSLDQVAEFMQHGGITPIGSPLAIFSDWDGRLVVVEAGFPVSREDAVRATGRIQAGETPCGAAVCVSHKTVPGTQQRRQEALADELRKAGLRTTGTMWEVYGDDPLFGGGRTDLYAQLQPSSASRAIPSAD